MTESEKGPRPIGLGKRARITTFFLRKFFQFMGWIKFVDVTVIGRSLLPKKGAIIVASNHISMIDIIILWTALRRPGIAIGAAEQIDRPFLRHIARLLGQISVRRGDAESGKVARQAAKNALAWMAAFIIYPQGGIYRPDDRPKLKRGVADFAHESDAPVYPVFIEGTDRVCPPRKFHPANKKLLNRGEKITMIVGEPLYPADFVSPEAMLIAIDEAIFGLRDELPKAA